MNEHGYVLAVGLGIRYILNAASPHSLRSSTALIGLWEGVILHHFRQKASKKSSRTRPSSRSNSRARSSKPRPNSPELHYPTYLLRLFIDLYFTRSPIRLLLVVFWTGIGLVLAELWPTISRDPSLRRMTRPFRRSILHIRLPSFRLPNIDLSLPGLSSLFATRKERKPVTRHRHTQSANSRVRFNELDHDRLNRWRESSDSPSVLGSSFSNVSGTTVTFSPETPAPPMSLPSFQRVRAQVLGAFDPPAKSSPAPKEKGPTEPPPTSTPKISSHQPSPEFSLSQLSLFPPPSGSTPQPAPKPILQPSPRHPPSSANSSFALIDQRFSKGWDGFDGSAKDPGDIDNNDAEPWNVATIRNRTPSPGAPPTPPAERMRQEINSHTGNIPLIHQIPSIEDSRSLYERPGFGKAVYTGLPPRTENVAVEVERGDGVHVFEPQEGPKGAPSPRKVSTPVPPEIPPERMPSRDGSIASEFVVRRGVSVRASSPDEYRERIARERAKIDEERAEKARANAEEERVRKAREEDERVEADQLAKAELERVEEEAKEREKQERERRELEETEQAAQTRVQAAPPQLKKTPSVRGKKGKGGSRGTTPAP